MTAGPDLPAVQCRPPDGCCGPSPCAVTEDDFICQLRALLPEGDLFNLTLPAEGPAQDFFGAATVGCYRVGCEQLIFGSCCEEPALACDATPFAPQLAVFDTFAAVAYQALQQICQMVREFDPCTADSTIRRWGERYGLVSDDPCAPQWSDHVLRALICAMSAIRHNVMNGDYLQELAGQFGAHVTVREAGDFSECDCNGGGTPGWWTMARDRTDCGTAPTVMQCAPHQPLPPTPPPDRPMDGLPLSLNIIVSPGDIVLPENCNIPGEKMQPHDPELYAAFKWLLTKILPQPAFYCVYERNLSECIQ